MLPGVALNDGLDMTFKEWFEQARNEEHYLNRGISHEDTWNGALEEAARQVSEFCEYQGWDGGYLHDLEEWIRDMKSNAELTGVAKSG